MPGEQREASTTDTSAVPSHSEMNLPPRRRIPLPCKFDLLVLVLRYLYTHSVCFGMSDTPDSTSVPTVLEANVEGVYELAVFLKLQPLREKALHFLTATCSIENISCRTFSAFARNNAEVGEIYESYILRNWKHVLSTGDIQKVVEAEQNPKLQKGILKKFVELACRQSKQ
jgi:hypothetical protein